MAKLFLGTMAFFNYTTPFSEYKLIKKMANTKNPLGLYILVMIELALFKRNEGNILKKLFKKYLKNQSQFHVENLSEKCYIKKATQIIS